MSVDDILGELESKEYYGETVDNEGMIYWLSKVSQIGQYVLGCLIIALSILLPLVIAIEFTYINLNIFRGIIDSIVDGEGRASSIIGMTCRDARESVREARISGRNPNSVYISIKIKSVIFISFVIGIIMQGTSVIVSGAGGIVGGFLDLLKNAVR